MPTLKRDLNQLASAGESIFEESVRPSLRPVDDGKFVAIDVDTRAFEIDDDDYAAVSRLRQRVPDADIWLMRIGYSTTCRIGVTR